MSRRLDELCILLLRNLADTSKQTGWETYIYIDEPSFAVIYSSEIMLRTPGPVWEYFIGSRIICLQIVKNSW